MTSELKSNKINGPIFVSIGDEEKLKVFLDNNPLIPSTSIFIDDREREAYKAIGLKGLQQQGALAAIKGTFNIKAPKLNGDEWKKYSQSIQQLTMDPKDLATIGGQLGATICISNNRVVKVFEERVPGDYPKIEDVLKIF